MKKITFLMGLLGFIFVFFMVFESDAVTAQDNGGNQEYVCLETDISGITYKPYLKPITDQDLLFEEYIPKQWKIVYDFNDIFENNHQSNRIHLLSLDEKNVWLHDSTNESGKLIRYSSDTNEYDYFFPNFQNESARWLQTNNNDYYYLEFFDENANQSFEQFDFGFYYFNKEINDFEKIDLPIEEIISNEKTKSSTLTYSNISTNLIEDEQGHIWFALFNQLLEYNPISKDIILHQVFLDEHFYLIAVQNIVVNQNKIWLVSPRLHFPEQGNLEPIVYNYSFLYYDIDTNELVDDYTSLDVGHPISYNSLRGSHQVNSEPIHNTFFVVPQLINIAFKTSPSVQFLLDDNENLWVNEYGYLTLRNEEYSWYMLLFSPLFIERNIRIGQDYRYNQSVIRPEFQIGNKIWFSLDRSIATLNTDSGEWCRIALMVDKEFYQNELGSFVFFHNKIYQVE